MRGPKKTEKFDSYRPYSAATQGLNIDGKGSYFATPMDDADISRRQYSASPGQNSKMGGITTPKKVKNFLIKHPSAKGALNRPNTGGNPENINGNDYARIKPRIVHDEKEKLFEDIHMYKVKNNLLFEENQKLKTKLLNLEKENAKFEKIIEDIEVNGLMNNQNLKINNDKNSFAAALKKSVKDLKIEIRFKTEEIEKLKKHIKFTKIQELEIEKKTFADETVRLKEVLEKLKSQNSEIVGKEIDFSSLEEKYYMQNNIINQQRKELQESNEQRKLNEEELMKLRKAIEAKDKQLKLKSIEMKKAVQEKYFEIQNLKSDYQIAIRKVQLLEAEDKRKGAILSRLQHDSVYGKYLIESTSGSQMPQQPQKQGDSGSKGTGRPSSSKKAVGGKSENMMDKTLKIQELEEKIKNMKENHQELLNFEKEEKRLLQQELEKEKNASQGWRSKYEALLGSPSRNEKRIGEERPQEKRPQERVRSPNLIPQKVKLEEIQSTIEELKFKMLAKEHKMNLIIKGIVPTSSEDTNEVTMSQIKDLLMMQPYNINNEKEAERLAKYLVERSLNEDMREVNNLTSVSSEDVQENFKKLFGSYNIMDQEMKEQIDEELIKVIEANKDKILKVLSYPNKRDERPTRNGFKEIFQLVDVNMSDSYLDYIMCKCYKSPNPESLDYAKTFELLSKPEFVKQQPGSELKSTNRRASQNEYEDEQFDEIDDEKEYYQRARKAQEEEANEEYDQYVDDEKEINVRESLRESNLIRASVKEGEENDENAYQESIFEDDGDV